MKSYILSSLILLSLYGFALGEHCPCRNRHYKIWFPSLRGTHSVLVPSNSVITEDQQIPNVKSDLYFTIFQDGKGEYRWNLKARNGKIIADSAEGYKKRQDCLHGIELIQGKSTQAEIVGK